VLEDTERCIARAQSRCEDPLCLAAGPKFSGHLLRQYLVVDLWTNESSANPIDIDHIDSVRTQLRTRNTEFSSRSETIRHAHPEGPSLKEYRLRPGLACDDCRFVTVLIWARPSAQFADGVQSRPAETRQAPTKICEG
jgi:hypothetical protein